MIFLFLLLVVSVSVQSAPEAVATYNGYEFTFYNKRSSDRSSYDDASHVCTDGGGSLAIIKNAGTQEFITTQLRGLTLVGEGWSSWQRGYWVGGVCGGGRDNWEWEDETTIGLPSSTTDYENWYSGVGVGCKVQEPNGNTNLTRAYVYPFDTENGCINIFGTWGDDKMDNKKNWICMRGFPTATYNGYLFTFYTYNKGSSDRLSYENASQVCTDGGGSLAIIKDAGTQDFITEQFRTLDLVEDFASTGWSGYWVGGVCSGGRNNWKWEDGTTIGVPEFTTGYENWHYNDACGVHEPNDNKNTSRAFVHAFEEATNGGKTCPNTLGTWGDTRKDARSNWICMKELWFNGFWWKFYNPSDPSGRLSYDAAKSKCEADGDQIAQIKDEATQQFITEQLGVLDFNKNNWENTKTFERGYWVGGVCVGCTGVSSDQGKWQWEDGTNIGVPGGTPYENWYNGVISQCGAKEPGNNQATSRIVVLAFDAPGSGSCVNALGRWSDSSDGSDGKPWICMEDLGSNPCKNGGSFIPVKDKCTCAPGYTGQRCEIDIDDCASNPCINGGTCTDGVNSFTCACAAGYTGDTCETDIDECASNPCMNGGKCTNGVNQFSCNCADGFTGERCQNDLCLPSPCENGGTCVPQPADYSCSCADGYSGSICEIDINECSSNPCINGGTCTDGVNQFTCNCTDGFTGKTCQNDLCSPSPCENGGTCVPQPGDYNCSCVDGFVGYNCTIDLCSPSPCENGGTCVPQPGDYSCSCADGYSGSTCETNIDECASNPCMNGGTCIDGVNSFTCICADGYTGDICGTDIDECASNPCMNGGTCTDGVNQFTCNCTDGFIGKTCQNDLCSPSPCENGGTCVPQPGDYSCLCVNGFIGYNCSIDLCSPSPCKNGGTCVPQPGDYSCSCVDGFVGDNCALDLCSPNPCENDGTCVPQPGDYNCSCADGFVGYNCTKDLCSPSPCENGGTCLPQPGDFSCSCVNGFIGYNCSIDLCSPSPCENGGTCIPQPGDYTCSCANGYIGETCRIDLCSSSPCENGGTCVPQPGDYSCTCISSYIGDLCQNANFQDNVDLGYKLHVNYYDSSTFSTSSKVCNSYGQSGLAIIKDQITQDNIQREVSGSGDFWIGAQKTEGVWFWLDGSPVVYQQWGTSDVTGDCLKIRQTENSVLKWYPEECSREIGYICEKSATDADPCIATDCYNSATCTSSGSHSNCQCADGYKGDNCEIKISDSTVAIIASVVAVVVVIIIIIIAICMWRKGVSPKDICSSKSKKQEAPRVEMPPTTRQNASSHHQENAQVDKNEAVYENVSFRRELFDYKIGVGGLLSKYRELLANDGLKFSQQYTQKLKEVVAKNEAKLSYSVAKLPQNKPKNRYGNICSYDHCRIKLKSLDSDYINAGYIETSDSSLSYIASQGPTDVTINDFWTMIWETNCQVIVMLTNLVEKGLSKCEQYWPEPGSTLKTDHFDVNTRDVHEEINFVERKLQLTRNDDKSRKQLITQVHFTTWPDHGVPSTTTAFLKFYQHVKDITGETPVVVHCSAGVGRTGTLIGFDILMSEMRQQRSVNIFETVANMRKSRTLMVQTLAQYIFLHKLLVEVHLFGTTEFTASEIKDKIREMSRKGNDGLSGFEAEFQKLEIIGPLDTSQEIAQKPCNRKFNRFPGILPYDNSRLVLPPMKPQDGVPAYYNGSLITGCEGFNGKVLVAQGPLHNEIKEFWHVIWNYDVTTIVMVTNLEEGAKLKIQCAKYWPDFVGQSVHHGATSVTLQHESEEINSLVTRTIRIKQGKVEKRVTQLHFNDWLEHGAPPSRDSILDLVRTLQESQAGSGGLTLVHCNDGAGRCGVLLSVANLLETIKNQNKIDVFRTVKDLRDMRPNMVKTQSEYRLIYEVCAKFMAGFDLYDNFKL